MSKAKVVTVRVRMTDGTEEKMIIPYTAKIYELKKMIENKKRIPEDRQRLIYGGKVLADNDTFKSINFQNEGVIFCVVRSVAG